MNRGGGTGGEQGSRATSVFLGERTKKSSQTFPSFNIYTIVHPQFLAPCTILVKLKVVYDLGLGKEFLDSSGDEGSRAFLYVRNH